MILHWAKRTRKRLKVVRMSIILVVLTMFVLILYGNNILFETDHEVSKFRSSYIPPEVIEFESNFVPNAGFMGKPYYISSQTKEEIDAVVKKYAFNKVASDQINVKRILPDFRYNECLKIKYNETNLPSTSIILIFNGEALSVLLRTIWSIITQTPPSLLKEIILIDDGSQTREMKEMLPMYMKSRFPKKVKLHRLKFQKGLIFARIAGAEFATGEVITFLDSHCEVTKGWIQPLLQRISENNHTVVIPQIDSISDRTLSYHGVSNGNYINVGTFTWSGHFSWTSYTGKRESFTDPVPTPTMAGGLFAINRKFFWHIGGYDNGMIGWGGENLELSFRLWRCHGRIETIPCSHVGHIFRSFHPYFIPKDSHGINTVRMAEVWMDDYKGFFYLYRTDLREKAKIIAKDLRDRHEIKKRLDCKSFKWYLESVIPGKFKMADEGIYWGRIRNVMWNDICLDHLQRDSGHNRESYVMGQYPCHSILGSTQYFVYSSNHQLRNEFMCGDVSNLQEFVMNACTENNNLDPTWIYTDKKQLIHQKSGLCLTADTFNAGSNLLMKLCIVKTDNVDIKIQQWEFEFRK